MTYRTRYSHRLLSYFVFLKMASKSIFDPTRSFAHPLLLRKSQQAHFSSRRRISEYLEVIPIQGKGLGVVAVRDVSSCTLLITESPAGIALGSPLLRSASNQSILEACCKMTPETRARFLALHEAPRPFETREMRIVS